MRVMFILTISVFAASLIIGCVRREPHTSVPPGFRYPEAGQKVLLANSLFAKRLAGRVLDPNGDPIKQALVEVTTDDWSNRISAHFTNERGWFEFPEVGRGEYSVKVTKPGFAPLLAKVKIAESGSQRVELMMHVAT